MPPCTRRNPLKAITLVEVIVALLILTLSMAGIMGVLMQSRRLTEGSVIQNSAVTIVQGYMEQMKNMELLQLVGGTTDTNGNLVLTPTSYTIPTLLDATTADPLQTSPGSPPALGTITPGVTPEDVVDNLKNFDTAKDANATTSAANDTASTTVTKQVAWRTLWPRALNYPVTTAGRTDLKLNVWVWITDLSGSSAHASKVYGITLIYTWQVADGNKVKYQTGALRSIRSSVPTF